MISDRVFLAFDTGRGLAYVQVSGKQRAYLLWTFRNFRSLPLKILNTRQRELVETLYRSPSIMEGRELDEATVIGTVDDFVPTLAADAPKPVTVEQWAPETPGNNSADVSTPTRHIPVHATVSPFTFPALARKAGAGALIALMVVVGWQQLRSRPVVSASTANPAAMPQASVANSSIENHPVDTGAIVAPQSPISSSTAVSPILIPQSSASETSAPPQVASSSPMAATHLSTASLKDVAASQSMATSQTPTSLHDTQSGTQQAPVKRGNNQIAANSSHAISMVAVEDSSAPLRVQISGPPRKLVYPLSPDDSTRGKVSLQAVVGYDGKVNQVKVLAGNRLLAAAAARAIREWRYQPFSENGQKLERETRITVSFIAADVVAVSFPETAQVSR